MDRRAYLEGVASLYSGEVWGEAFASRWLEHCTEARERHVLSMVLQMESEAKVRLRPLLASLGLSLVEEDAQRKAGAAAVEPYLALAWPEAMRAMAELARPYRDQYQALLDAAPPSDAPMVGYMVAHEQALMDFAQRVAAGDVLADTELLPLLAHPLPND
jgi:hypothetical protein